MRSQKNEKKNTLILPTMTSPCLFTSFFFYFAGNELPIAEHSLAYQRHTYTDTHVHRHIHAHPVFLAPKIKSTNKCLQTKLFEMRREPVDAHRMHECV